MTNSHKKMKKRCHYLTPIAFSTSHYSEVQCQDDLLFFKYWDLLPCLVLNLPPKNGAKWQFRKIFYIFLIACLEPKIFIYRSSSKEQSCRAHKIGQILTPISLLYLFLFKSYRLRKNSLSASSERVKGTQRRILQIWLFSTQPNPQTSRLGYFDVVWKSFSWIPLLIFSHVVWWSMALWTARITRRRRPGLLDAGCPL